MTTEGITRRQTLTGAAALGVATPLLAACGGGDSGTATDAPPAGKEIGPASEVPVGGGKIFAEPRVVVTQLTEGEYEAFSAVCTHQGCLVSRVEAETIDCLCHGSKFSTKDGSVVNGPATAPLPPVKITVDGGTITTA